MDYIENIASLLDLTLGLFNSNHFIYWQL